MCVLVMIYVVDAFFTTARRMRGIRTEACMHMDRAYLWAKEGAVMSCAEDLVGA